jgi:hypothetical protein
MNIQKTCQYCGSEYFVRQSQEHRSKFCSDECFRKSRNKQIDYNCDYCGKLFKVAQLKYEKMLNGEIKHLYCCRDCANNDQKPKWSDIVALFQEKEYILISDEYISAKTKLEYICSKHKEHGSQYITYNNIKCGFGCKYCGIERVADSKRLSFEEAKLVFDAHDMILLDQEYKNTETPLKYICKHHTEIGVQYMSLSNARKQHCPHCNLIKGENKITHYFIEHNIQFDTQKSYDDLRGVKGGKLSYDFYLPNFNLLIEYQGEQHEHPIEVFGGEEQFMRQQEHDARKRQYAKNHCIELLEIWYYDFSHIEEILDEKILLIA